jgi:hypothetical protein
MPSSLVRAHAAVEDRSSSARAPPPPLYRGVDGGYMARLMSDPVLLLLLPVGTR